MAQEFVSDRLKSPGSAKYPTYDPSYVTITSPNSYTVASYVDSQNGFGALLRSDWTMHLTKNGDKFSATNINITEK